MFAAKYKLGTMAKVFAIAGKDLSKTIGNDSVPKKSQIVGQTEDKIHQYLEGIGIKRRKSSKQEPIGVVYTKYKSISRPDIAPLAKEFNPTF